VNDLQSRLVSTEETLRKIRKDSEDIQAELNRVVTGFIFIVVLGIAFGFIGGWYANEWKWESRLEQSGVKKATPR
jgi:hypothetical protein